MKKPVLSCAVFLAGVIGAIGWVIACAATTSGRASVVLGSVYGED